MWRSMTGNEETNFGVESDKEKDPHNPPWTVPPTHHHHSTSASQSTSSPSSMSSTKTHSALSHQSNGSGPGSIASNLKSHVLAGVQDAYWSDDEAEDVDCPLCMEEMDLSDLNFKPCQCGYQICQFCWHHIMENLNGRCPACRRAYSQETVEFKPISPEDQKRLNQQKRLRERERKELENLKRSHLVNVRVVQRNLVYVTGMGSRFAKEELIPSLRSTEYFGKYGKISKIVLVKRTASASRAPVVGLYITYHRREDAARAIAAVDGTASPGGDGEIVRASYGTTKYCMSFLRGVACTTQGCLDLHEWGDEKDCFTKEDLTTLKHAMKDTENRGRIVLSRKQDEADGPALPRTAQWGQKGATPVTSSAIPTPLPSGLTNGRSKNNGRNRDTASSKTAGSENRGPNNRTRAAERRAAAQAAQAAHVSGSSSLAATAPVPSLSRPTTPGIASLPSRPSTASEISEPVPSSPLATAAKPAADRITSPVRNRKQKSVEKVSVPVTEAKVAMPELVPEAEPSPKPPVARVQDIRTDSVPPLSPSSTAADSIVSTETPPPPPGLPLPPLHSTYQLSNQAQALMDDVLNRRATGAEDIFSSPFPDFDRTLSNLGDGSFTFNLSIDPKTASLHGGAVDIMTSSPITNGIFDPFSTSQPQSPYGQQSFPPPGINPRRPPSSASLAHSSLSGVQEMDSRTSRGSFSSISSYAGSFNPFAESTRSQANESPVQRAQPTPLDDDPLRRGSKFGFARKESSNGGSFSFGGSANSSPLRYTDALPSTPLYTSSDLVSPKPQMQQTPSWTNQRQQEYSALPPPGIPHGINGYDKPSPRPQFQSASNGHGSFSPFGNVMNGNGMGPDGALNLKDILSLGNRQPAAPRHRAEVNHQDYPNPGFVDPAIMSMRINPAYNDNSFAMNNGHQMTSPHPAYMGPPGLTTNGPPPGMGHIENIPYNLRAQMANNAARPAASPNPTNVSASTPSTPASPVLSTSDFPALPPPSAEPQSRREHAPLVLPRSLVPKVEPPPVKAPVSKRPNNPPPVRAPIPLPAKPNFDPDLIPPTPRKPRSESIAELTIAALAPPVPPPAVEATPAPTPAPAPVIVTSTASRKSIRRPSSPPMLPSAPVVIQEPLVSRKAKKNKPNTKPFKTSKEKDKPKAEETSKTDTTASHEGKASGLKAQNSIEELSSEFASTLQKLAPLVRGVHLDSLFFFDEARISPKNQLPLRYGPLVYALAALSVGGTAVHNSLPAGTIDSAVTSFQQLLETLTQTISDLLRLFPRATWEDTASFDGVLHFLDDVPSLGDVNVNGGRQDDVASLTVALEKRARWMEIQLVKLEELHHDINLAAVRAVLASNDRGWDREGVLPRVGGTLERFDSLGSVTESDGNVRKMTLLELEEAHAQAVKEELEAEQNLTKTLRANQGLLTLIA